MAYITKANAVRILRKINLNDIPDIEGEVYKKPIYFLSKSETKYLLLMQSLLKEPEKFAIEVYHPVVNKDTFQYVFESGQPPSYHSNKNCERLTSNFKNFVIPSEIKERVRERAKNEGKNEQEIVELEKQQVEVFRAWFNKNFELFNADPEEFLKKLDIRWNIKRNVREIERDNSGVKTIDNLNLSELEAEIDKIISEAGRYFVNNKDKQRLIRRFQKLTILAYRKGKIDINETELSDDELEKFLLEYDTKFKKPIKELLVQYYRVKYNQDLSFEGPLLERLNFRACSVCDGKADFNYIRKDKALASAGLLTFSIENVEVKLWKSGQVSFRATCDNGEVVTFWESTADRVVDEIAPGRLRLKAGVNVAKDGGLIPPKSGFWS